jgi:ABC-2 type transport system ATP-binding protein
MYSGTKAVDRLNLGVPQGALYGFLGRNGAGKTTTMKMLLGLARPTSGRATVFGIDPAEQLMPILKRTAFVDSRKKLYDDLTPNQLLRFIQDFHSNGLADIGKRYAQRMEIPLDKRFGKLSGGNRAKVCLWLALTRQPDLLVLDEPTVGLDPLAVDELLRILIEDHEGAGRTIFFSSHQLTEVEQICDWVGIIDRGQLLLEAQLEDIRNDYRIIIATGNRLPAIPFPGVISAVKNERSYKYVVPYEAEKFAAELRQEGAEVLDCSPITLRELFLELVRKEDPCTPGNFGTTPATVSTYV